MCFCLFHAEDLKANNYKEGDALVVMANSGLCLRMSPDMHGKTIRILAYGEKVEVVETFGFAGTYRGRAGWMDGHWVKVRSGQTSGYVFDAFLTSLTPPTHEDQLCNDCDNIMLALDRYLFDNFAPRSMVDGPDHSEEINQTVTCLSDSICTTHTSGEGWYSIEVTFSERRLSEVLGVMRSLMVGNAMRDAFDASLVFHEDRDGFVRKVDIYQFARPVRIEISSDSAVTVSTTFVNTEDGC